MRGTPWSGVVGSCVVFVLALAGGCSVPTGATTGTGGIGGSSGLGGAAIGAPCSPTVTCRTGLTCQAATSTCQVAAQSVPGAKCVLSGECLPGYYCAATPPTPACIAMGSCFGACAPRDAMAATVGVAGATCQNEGQCADGLTCALTGITGTCVAAGLGDLGAACASISDCRAGLYCAGATCKTFAQIKPWAGAMCPDETPLPPKVHFHVPRAGEVSEDFYRLPFPNDIRIKAGKVSMTGFPRPGLQLLPFDPVERYTKAVEDEMTGFGTNTGVFFRFSKNPAFGSLNGGAISFVNISPASPGYALGIGHTWYASTGGGKFICPRYLVVRPGLGEPLAPATTYAVLLHKAITDEAGTPMAADADFTAMLAETAPAGADADLAAAWTAYAPLRAYLKEQKVAAGEIIGAAVFTTEDVEAPIMKLRQAAEAVPAAMLGGKGIIKCGDAAAVSPCDDGKTGAEHTRGCPAAIDPKFDEYQGKITLPVFQKGVRPYENEGGNIEVDPTTKLPVLQGTEDVCFTLTVPKGEAPAAGWPLVVYSHGTNGDYRNVVELGHAADFAESDVGGKSVKMATFGYEAIMHGTRKGVTTKASQDLVFNILNPRAARDNALAGGADLFVLARYFDKGLLAIPGVKIDPARLVLYGHSQGGNAGALAAGYEARYGAVVLSGAGAMLSQSILEKKKPVDIAAALPIVFGEAVDLKHPLVNVLQMYFERSDQVNTARRIATDPPMGVPGKHFLHVYGSADTYAPPSTQTIFAAAGQFPTYGAFDAVNVPPLAMGGALSKTGGPGGAFTVLHLQYKPDGYDGHFVATRNMVARAAVRQFITTFAADGTSVVTVGP